MCNVKHLVSPRWFCGLAVGLALVGAQVFAQAEKAKTLQVLFIGNSYTARHNLAKVVKAMAEEGNPGLRFAITSVIYGGRRLVDHWRLGTANYVRLSELTMDEENATIAALTEMLKKDPKDKYAKTALNRHRRLARSLGQQPHPKWDIVVLQSYRDDAKGDASLYVEYAPKFAELIKAQGARVVLYETTPRTQNAKPLTSAPKAEPILAKARIIAKLAKSIDASVVPMSLVAHRCQTERPDLTLRFINDAHLNQTMAYLTACTFYATLFERSPEGLALDAVTDIRFLAKDKRDKDRDGEPIKRVFSGKDRADLQRIAWEGFKQFEALRENMSIK
ncbi:MAG: hypothetical protein KAI66_03990 [Lentisphaeria bacterium]|nr:hypothetical protein [Lentisphaeria bacterium]